MKLAVYLSGHGLGHAARTCEVLRHVSVVRASCPQETTDVSVEITSSVPPSFLQREIGSSRITVRSAALDVGLVQAGNREIDWNETQRQVSLLRQQTDMLLREEEEYLQRGGFHAVYSDMPTLAIRAAARAGLPSIVLTNFTWDQIYAACPDPYLFSPDDLAILRQDLAQATRCLVPALNLPIPHPSPEPVGLISRLGQARRSELLADLGLPTQTRLVLVYLGAWGDRLPTEITRPDPLTAYLSFHPLPAPVHQISSDRWPFHDVLASVDAMLAKPGYGVVASALAHGVRLVHHSREEFAEYPALLRALTEANNVQVISLEDLETGNWAGSAEKALSRPTPIPQEASGAKVTATIIDEILSRY